MRKETSQKNQQGFPVLTTAVLGKIKDLQKFSNKEIHIITQSDNTKHRP